MKVLRAAKTRKICELHPKGLIYQHHRVQHSFNNHSQTLIFSKKHIAQLQFNKQTSIDFISILSKSNKQVTLPKIPLRHFVAIKIHDLTYFSSKKYRRTHKKLVNFL